MSRRAWMQSIVLAILTVPTLAWGGLTNGSFTGGSTSPWDIAATGDGATYWVEPTYSGSDNVLAMKAVNNADNYSDVVANGLFEQDGLGNYLPAGTTRLAFLGGIEVLCNDSSEPRPTIDVSVIYSKVGQMMPAKAILTLTEADAAFGPRSLELPDIDVTAAPLLVIRVQNELTSAMTATGYFDNFSFVPEPATMALLAVGVMALTRRRR